MRACVFGKVPYSNAARSIAADDLALVWVYDNIVGGGAMVVASLDSTGSGLPDLHCAILRACNHPLPFAVESDPRDIACVTFKDKDRGRVGGAYVE